MQQPLFVVDGLIVPGIDYIRHRRRKAGDLRALVLIDRGPILPREDQRGGCLAGPARRHRLRGYGRYDQHDSGSLYP